MSLTMKKNLRSLSSSSSSASILSLLPLLTAPPQHNPNPDPNLNPSPNQNQPPITLSQITHHIITAPRFESTLLSHFPSPFLFHTSTLSHLLSSPSLLSNPFLSLRLLSFLSSHKPHLPSLTPSLTTHLTKFYTRLLANSPPSLSLPALSSSFSAFHFPPSSSARLLVRFFLRQNKPHDAFRALRSFATSHRAFPDLPTIRKLIAAFSRTGNFSKVSQILHLMIASGEVMPDATVYQEIVSGLCVNGLGMEGLRVFNDLNKRGYSPDVVSYTTVIGGLCRIGRMREAEGVWKEMIGMGIRPNGYTYNVVVGGWFKFGDVERAKSMYNEMVEAGIQESNVSCNVMIYGLCSKGRIREAIEFFEEMGRKGIERDVITYNAVIRGLCRERKMEEGMRFYEELLERRLIPNVQTYAPLIKALCGQENVDGALKLVEKMKERGIKPSFLINECIVIALCREGRIEEGLVWLVRMLGSKLRPRPQLFNRVLEYLSLAGRRDDVLPVLSAMFEIGCLVERPVCYQLVDKLCCRDDRLQTEELLGKILVD